MGCVRMWRGSGTLGRKLRVASCRQTLDCGCVARRGVFESTNPCVNELERADDGIVVSAQSPVAPDSIGERTTNRDEHGADREGNADDTKEDEEVCGFAPDAHETTPFRTIESADTEVWPPAR